MRAEPHREVPVTNIHVFLHAPTYNASNELQNAKQKRATLLSYYNPAHVFWPQMCQVHTRCYNPSTQAAAQADVPGKEALLQAQHTLPGSRGARYCKSTATTPAHAFYQRMC